MSVKWAQYSFLQQPLYVKTNEFMLTWLLDSPLTQRKHQVGIL